MRPFQRVLLCLASFALASFGHAQTPSVDESITVMGFQSTDGLPKEVVNEYASLFRDTKLAGAPEPRVFVHYHATANTSIEMFVRVESPLTCSASGECQIDLYSLNREVATRLFSVVASNIAMDDRRSVTSKDGLIFPVLFTNVVISGQNNEARQTQQDARVLLGTAENASKAYGAEWAWDGKAYRAVQ
jgi:hypothetical protein